MMRTGIFRLLLLPLLGFLAYSISSLYNDRQSSAPFSRDSILSSPDQDVRLATTQQQVILGEDLKSHPVDFLVKNAQQTWTSLLDRQSHTLDEAVAEYRRRYHIPPPPHFDKWFKFAKDRGVTIIDEYDNIHDSLKPFWGILPATIRARTREALGYENKFVAVKIRDGKVELVQDGPEWMQTAMRGMLEGFVEHLPNMDLAFNVHDEPRVVVPHDRLSRLLSMAQRKDLQHLKEASGVQNTFSNTPDDLKDSKRFAEIKTTRFNKFSRQQAWLPSTLSCPPDSPARALDEILTHDDTTAWAMTDLSMIYNHSAFTDVCNSPSLQQVHGFFDRPNAFNVVHDLFPVLSQSKMSSFQDILYPSPWYWSEQVKYEETQDSEWHNKSSKLWWRGSTTGGYSRNGSWRRQHRQRLVQKLNALDKASILKQTKTAKNSNDTASWEIEELPRSVYKRSIDVHFSDVGQCDPGDCDAQKEFFNVSAYANQEDAWNHKFLLDMDGNAFSGRFYAFLQSRSVTLKMAMFREWHDFWIKPWVHYIPLSLGGDEALEVVKYLSEAEDGQRHAEHMAETSRQWAQHALRKDDMETWFFRLLLEYGRVVDDNRASIGYQK